MTERRELRRLWGPSVLLAALATAFAAPTALAVETPLEINVSSIDFGAVNVGNTDGPVAVTVTNTGATPFGPMSMFGGAPATDEFNASQNCQGATLAAGASCTISYNFSPSGPGSFSDTSSFTISQTASQADGEAFSVTLSGTGVNPITVTPTSIDFGAVPVGTTSSTVAAVVTNTSSDPFGPINMFGGAPSTVEFNASQNCQGTTIAAGATCSISYTFSPGATGLFSGTSSFTISATASQADGVAFVVTLAGCGSGGGEPCAVAPSPTPPPTTTPAPSAPAPPTPSAAASVPATPVASKATSASAPPSAGQLPDTASPSGPIDSAVSVALAVVLSIGIGAQSLRARSGRLR